MSIDSSPPSDFDLINHQVTTIQKNIEELPLSLSSKKILHRLESWKLCKEPIMERFRSQLKHIDAMKAEIEPLIATKDIAKFEEVIRALLMDVDSVRYHTLSHLCIINNKAPTYLSKDYRVYYLTSVTYVEGVVTSSIQDDGWEFLSIGVGSYYDIGIVFGSSVELIQMDYVLLIENSDGCVKGGPLDQSLYVFDGAQHIIHNIYQLTAEACFFVPKFEIPKDGLSVQMNFRVLKKR